jgi:hypothetical protein
VRARRLHGSEFVGMAGAALVVAGPCLPWYATDPADLHSHVGGRTGSLSAREAWAAARRSSDSERPRKPPGPI